jgi:hypothetical protein
MLHPLISDERLNRARHELGHAFLAHELGFIVESIDVVDCNRNEPGLQSTEIWDRIICIYLSLQDGILCN